MMQGFTLILAITGVILAQRTAEANNFDHDDSESNYSKVSCDFSNESFCGWENVGGERNNLTWTIGYNVSDDNHYVRLDLSNRTFDSPETGELVSPWLKPKQPGYNCTLQFSYYNELPGGCQFFLYQSSAVNSTFLWEMPYGTGKHFKVHSENVICTKRRFRLVFRGSRSRGNWPCGDDPQTSIAIDDIVFYVDDGENELTPPVFSSTASQTIDITTELGTANPDAGKVAKKNTNHNDDEDETDLGTSTIVTIVVATVVVVIVFVICISITILKTRQRKTRRRPLVHFKSSSRTSEVTCGRSDGVNNTAFTSAEHEGTGAATHDYETVNDGGSLVTSLSCKTDDVYNKLGVEPDAAAERRVPQNHYDHFNTTSDTYDQTHMWARRREEARGNEADTYTHISTV